MNTITMLLALLDGFELVLEQLRYDYEYPPGVFARDEACMASIALQQSAERVSKWFDGEAKTPIE